MKRLVSTIGAVLIAMLVMHGTKHVIEKMVFPDKLITLDPLGLLVGKVEASYIPSVLKSLQTGSIDFNGCGCSSKTATITSISTADYLLLHEGFTLAGSSAAETTAATRLTLTNATTVTALWGASGAGVAFPTNFTVVELRPGVLKSNQTGVVNLNTAASQTATITAVVVAKSLVINLGSDSNNAGAYDAQFRPKLALTSTTVVTSTSGAADASATTKRVGFQVAEFN